MSPILRFPYPPADPPDWPPIRGTYGRDLWLPYEGRPDLTVDEQPFWPWAKCIKWALGLSALFWLFVALSYLTMRAMG